AALWELSVKSAANPDEEEAAHRELVKRFPDEPKYALALGGLLVQRNRQDQARELLGPLGEQGTPANRAGAHFQLARSHYRRDELADALKHLDEAAALDAEAVNTVRAWTLRG